MEFEWDVNPWTASEVYKQGQGMTLRDWFAGQALTGVMATANGLGEATVEQRAEIFNSMCRVIYELADAMMEARKK